ncbi:MAG TPA: TetR/AcrR family transcriptional regulator [Dehalococcoidia bacterium]|nr:TetR/AcrR family transcriptional regulator [Dehalococcoidia bacterium]
MSQNEGRGDLRVRRTERAIRAAMIELIVEKGDAAISVNDLAERAMINRATFYRHYRDKEELLERLIADMLDGLARSIGPTSPSGAPEVFLNEIFRAMRRIFEHVAEHGALYRALMATRGSHAFEAQVRGYVESVLKERWRLGEGGRSATGIPEAVGIAFSVTAFLGTIAWWLEASTPYSPDQMSGWLAALFVLGPVQAAGWQISAPGQFAAQRALAAGGGAVADALSTRRAPPPAAP